MKQLLKRLSTFFVFSSLFLINPHTSFAQTTEWSGRCVSNGDVATIQGFECLFYNILQVIVYFAGIAFFVMFVSGGFKYLFSSQDSKKVAAASSVLTMSVIGLVGVIASWFIIRFIQNFTGIDVVNFVIPS